MKISVYEGEVRQGECEELKLSYGLTQSEQTYELNCGIFGDAVKFHKRTGIIVLYEVVIVGLGNSLILSYSLIVSLL